MKDEDWGRFSSRLQGQLEAIDNHGHKEERAAMFSWSQKLVDEGLPEKTITTYLRGLRRVIERSDRPLTEVQTRSEIETILREIYTGARTETQSQGLSENTLKGSRTALRRFFSEELNRAWGNQIRLPFNRPDGIDRNEILFGDDVDTLLDESTRLRDSAYIALRTVTGMGVEEIVGLDISNVDRTGSDMTVSLPTSDTDTPRMTVKLGWAERFVEDWLRQHPYRENEEAALFCCLKGRKASWEASDRLSATQARARLTKIARNGGISRKKVSEDSFRNTAVLRYLNCGVSDSQIISLADTQDTPEKLEEYKKTLRKIKQSSAGSGSLAIGRPTSTDHLSTRRQPTGTVSDASDLDQCFIMSEAVRKARKSMANDLVEIEDNAQQEFISNAIQALDVNPDMVEAAHRAMSDSTS